MCTYNVYNVYIYTCMHVYMPYMFVYTCTRAVTIYTLYIDEGGVCIGHVAQVHLYIVTNIYDIYTQTYMTYIHTYMKTRAVTMYKCTCSVTMYKRPQVPLYCDYV